MALNPNWKSRKWWIALLAILYGLLVHLFPAISDKVREEDLKAVVTILLTWLGVEGAADVVSRLKVTRK